MYINLLDNVGLISNKEVCLKILRDQCRRLRNVSERNIAYKVNENYDEKQNRYFGENFTTEYDKDEARVKYLWVNTGFSDRLGNTLYIQFGKSALGWQGGFVGNSENIKIFGRGSFDKVNNFENEAKIEVVESVSASKIEVEKNSDLSKSEPIEKTEGATNRVFQFYSNLYSRLLIQSGWDLNKPFLRNYIELLVSRINNKISSGDDYSDFLVFNKEGTHVLYNSALLDKFGKSILIIDQLFLKEDQSYELSYTKQFVVESKSMLLNLGFSKESVSGHLERVPFYNEDISELVFSASIEDFDLENWSRLTHCICERKERFPEKSKALSDEVLCSDMIRAIELGIKLGQYDSSYVKPVYNPRYNEIHFVIPYHVGNNFTEEADLGIVVAKNKENELWQVMTILDKEKASSDIKFLSIYSNNSL